MTKRMKVLINVFYLCANTLSTKQVHRMTQIIKLRPNKIANLYDGSI